MIMDTMRADTNPGTSFTNTKSSPNSCPAFFSFFIRGSFHKISFQKSGPSVHADKFRMNLSESIGHRIYKYRFGQEFRELFNSSGECSKHRSMKDISDMIRPQGKIF